MPAAQDGQVLVVGIGGVVARRVPGAVAVGSILHARHGKTSAVAEARAILAAGESVPPASDEVGEAAATRSTIGWTAPLKPVCVAVLPQAAEAFQWRTRTSLVAAGDGPE
jgi:plasmid stability protein